MASRPPCAEGRVCTEACQCWTMRGATLLVSALLVTLCVADAQSSNSNDTCKNVCSACTENGAGQMCEQDGLGVAGKCTMTDAGCRATESSDCDENKPWCEGTGVCVVNGCDAECGGGVRQGNRCEPGNPPSCAEGCGGCSKAECETSGAGRAGRCRLAGDTCAPTTADDCANDQPSKSLCPLDASGPSAGICVADCAACGGHATAGATCSAEPPKSGPSEPAHAPCEDHGADQDACREIGGGQCTFDFKANPPCRATVKGDCLNGTVFCPAQSTADGAGACISNGCDDCAGFEQVSKDGLGCEAAAEPEGCAAGCGDCCDGEGDPTGCDAGSRCIEDGLGGPGRCHFADGACRPTAMGDCEVRFCQIGRAHV